jgi:hypothetical protein
MAERVISVLAGLLPVLIVVPLFTNLLGGFFGFVQPQTRSVSKEASNTSRVELQKAFVSTRRHYGQVFLRFVNNTGSAQDYYVKIGAWFDNQSDLLTNNKIITAYKVRLEPGQVSAITVTTPAGNPEDSQRFLNKWLIVELGANADVFVSYTENEF